MSPRPILHTLSAFVAYFGVTSFAIAQPLVSDIPVEDSASLVPRAAAAPATGAASVTTEPLGENGVTELTPYDHIRLFGIRINFVTCCGTPELFMDVARFNVASLSPRASLGVSVFTATAASSNERQDEDTKDRTWEEHYAFSMAAVHFEYLLYRGSKVNLLFEARAEPLGLLYHQYKQDYQSSAPLPDDEWKWGPSLDVGLFAPWLIAESPVYVLGLDAGYHLGVPDHPAMVARGYGVRVGVTFGIGFMWDDD